MRDIVVERKLKMSVFLEMASSLAAFGLLVGACLWAGLR